MLTNKNTFTIVGGTRKTTGAASCPAIEIRGEGVFLFIGQIISPSVIMSRGMEVVPCGTTSTLGLFLFHKNSKNYRRQIMSNDRMWQKPQTPGEAADTLDKLSDVIQFIKDLTSQPTPPIDEYDLSSDGYSGLFFFFCFIQDTIHDCQDGISNKPSNNKGGA